MVIIVLCMVSDPTSANAVVPSRRTRPVLRPYLGPRIVASMDPERGVMVYVNVALIIMRPLDLCLDNKKRNALINTIYLYWEHDNT